MMKARVHTPSIGTGQTRKQDKQQISEQLRRDTDAFIARGGRIQELVNRQSEFKPTWRAYAAAAFDERGEV
jgi:hypothetical protein